MGNRFCFFRGYRNSVEIPFGIPHLISGTRPSLERPGRQAEGVENVYYFVLVPMLGVSPIKFTRGNSRNPRAKHASREAQHWFKEFARKIAHECCAQNSYARLAHVIRARKSVLGGLLVPTPLGPQFVYLRAPGALDLLPSVVPGGLTFLTPAAPELLGDLPPHILRYFTSFVC